MIRFIVILSKHTHFGLQFIPCLAEFEKDFVYIKSRFSSEDNSDTLDHLTTLEQQIVSMCNRYSNQELLARFGRPKEQYHDFVARLTPEYIQQHIRPFIEMRMGEVFLLLQTHGIPVYPYNRNDSLYATDGAYATSVPAEVKFGFYKTTEHIIYRQQLLIDGQRVDLKGSNPMVMTLDPCRLLVGKRMIYFAEPIDAKLLSPFFSKEELLIPLRMEKEWFEKFLVKVAGRFQIDADGFDVEDVRLIPRMILYFELNWKRLPVLRPLFVYGKTRVRPRSKETVFSQLAETREGHKVQRVLRNKELEQRLLEMLVDARLTEASDDQFMLLEEGEGVPVQDLAVYFEWIVEHDKQLTEHNITIDKSYFRDQYYIGRYELSTELSQQHDWFELKILIHFNQFRIPFIYLRNNILEGIREYFLPDGTVFLIPAAWFSRYGDVFVYGTVEGATLRIALHHAGILKGMVSGDEELRAKLQRFTGVPQAEAEVPSSLRATLRDYQKEGYQWMMHLRSLGLNGCLADDMGLGKTVQAIAMLCAVYDQSQQEPMAPAGTSAGGPGVQLSLFGTEEPITAPAPPEKDSTTTPENISATVSDQRPGPTLIVAPVTLIYNWRSELKRFAPHLKTTLYTGKQRESLIAGFASTHVVLTTYGMIRTDHEILRQIQFHYIILDESQLVKNPGSITYKSLLMLQSQHRLALTGTPVENSLSDLYAQMHFLNRNIFGSPRFFRKEFLRPLMADEDDGAFLSAKEKLMNIISPLVIRRTKEQVAQELPPKTEKVVFCRMTPGQESLYEEEKSRIRNHILEHIGEHTLERSSTVIINGLNRLRQLACHPAMVFPDQTEAGSGKLDQVARQLRTLSDEGHKTLVISSYRKHLDHVAGWLDKELIPYVSLTGATRNTEEVIERFKDDRSVKVMLMTLKKGGYGLNLTEADYVLILDPWWNPASQQQGTDRVHRIGQDKPVFVYKYITLGSVEEKIMQLQREKKRIADTVVGVNNPLVSLLTRERLTALLGSE